MPPINKPRAHARIASRCGVLVSALLIFIAARVTAQESFRFSLAGQAAAEAKAAELANEKFNVKYGPFGLRFSTSLAFDATDNAQSQQTNALSELTIRPQLSAVAVWRVSARNSLVLNSGVGYNYYVNGSSQNSLFITPNTDLSFDIYVGDAIINLHDQFTYAQDLTSLPEVSGISTVNRIENTAGLNVTWDLNKVILYAGYDHFSYTAQDAGFKQQDRKEEVFTANAAFPLGPRLQLGVQGSGGITDNASSGFQDSTHMAGGPFFNYRITEKISFRVSAGFVAYDYAAVGTNTQSNAKSQNTIYGDLSLRQRLSKSYSHSLSVGRRVQSSAFSDSIDLMYARYSAVWRLFRRTTVTPSVSFEHFTDTATLQETAGRFGFALSLGRPLTRRINGNLSYQHYEKISNLGGRDYSQNRLVLDLSYQF